MKEKADAILVPAFAQRLGERHQVIIMHPDEVIWPEHFMQLSREVIVDTQIAQTNDDDVLPFGDEDDQNQIYLIEPGTMSERGGMMGRGWHHGWHRGRAMMPPVMARIIFSLMDADGDGTVSLQEWQAAHERIFKAMDTDHDGTVSFEEMQAFMRGRGGQ
ncbi:MAG: EF-hand domain-containing protein [Xanthobacteraceae bacterium]